MKAHHDPNTGVAYVQFWDREPRQALRTEPLHGHAFLADYDGAELWGLEILTRPPYRLAGVLTELGISEQLDRVNDILAMVTGMKATGAAKLSLCEAWLP